MTLKFKTIGLVGKQDGSSVVEAIVKLDDHLTNKGLHVLLDKDNAAMMSEHNMEMASIHELGARCDLVITVGGDGTLLNAARSLADSRTPLVGVNLGHLGFLTDISPVLMLECIDEILAGKHQEEDRSLLSCHVTRNDETINESIALNDVVVHKWNVSRMVVLEMYIDDKFVSQNRSDGLIISTPTGSTAYALSSGGPIIHPALNVIAVVPVCPHTMSYRPIVISGDSQITIVVSDVNQDSVRVTCDGQIPFQLAPDDRVHIKKKQQAVRLLHPAQHDHYDMLRAKLFWAEPPKRKI